MFVYISQVIYTNSLKDYSTKWDNKESPPFLSLPIRLCSLRYTQDLRQDLRQDVRINFLKLWLTKLQGCVMMLYSKVNCNEPNAVLGSLYSAPYNQDKENMRCATSATVSL